jgi:hypothetical protein
LNRARRGFGIVIGLTLLFVMIFAVGGASLGGLGARVKGTVKTGQEMARAHAMARAVVEELAFLVQTSAASATSPVGQMLRDVTVRLPAEGLALPVPIGPDGPPVFAKEVAPAYPELKLVSASAKLIDIRAFRTTLLPWHGDHYGTVAIEARVGQRRGGTEVIAERWLEMKVVRAGPTPPFDVTTLAMIDPWGWCHGKARYHAQTTDENANQLVGEIMLDVAEARKQVVELKQKITQFEGLSPEAAAEARAGVAEGEAALAANRELIGWWEGPNPEPDHKFMRTPHIRYVLSKGIEGDEVNLPLVYATHTPTRLKESQETDQLRTQLPKIQSAGEALRVVRALRRSSLALFKVDMLILTEMRRIQELFVRRVGPTQMQVFSPHLSILRNGHEDRTALSGGAASFSAGRVTHRVRGGGANAGLAKLLATFGKPFTGIVDVENQGEPLALPGPLAGFEGRLVLIARGDVNVSGLAMGQGGGKPAGMVTIICHGMLKASGQVEASLVALDRFATGGPLTVKGNLFIDGYQGQAFRDGTAPQDVLRGITIVEDPRLRSLDPANFGGPPRPDSYRVLFGPRPVRDVMRRGEGDAS